MVFVSITRLRLRSWRYLAPFAWRTLQARAQARRSAGYLGGALLADRKLTFWTMTLWRDGGDMKRYIASGSHHAAMPKLLDWCDEASIVHWQQDTPVLPDWTEADRRMRAEGRPSKVRHPGAHHRDLSFDRPRTTRGVPL